jgi:hypothetical protein
MNPANMAVVVFFRELSFLDFAMIVMNPLPCRDQYPK